MDANALRAWWAHKQGLDGTLQGDPPAAVLERTGWARSVAGVNPYLTLFARAGTSREAVDKAVVNLEIHELPSARGCTYVLPHSDFALGLRCGRDAAEMPLKVAAKLGVTEKEIDKLCAAILQALKKGTMDPDGIREAIGGASRSLGPEGVKKGMTTTLPLGLGKLQVTGAIRRVPVNGRLDQQRYKYTLWNFPALQIDDAEAFAQLARRFYQWIGPAKLSEFQWFSGLGVKAAQNAVAPLGLASLDDGALLFPEDLEALRSFQAPKQPQVSLLASIDGLIHHRRNHLSLLDKPANLHANVGAIADLPSHAITDRGRLIGLWEYDTATESIAWVTFEKAAKEVAEAVKVTESYIKAQLGDARSFSLDSPKSRVPRLTALRAAAG
ncbi:MAG: winged helix DNA-binding domain-containing protein [Acidobacteria bacterium]|nr:winged helix DNA-binding domain-containing protein [Acidobacteriota bacterium]